MGTVWLPIAAGAVIALALPVFDRCHIAAH
jgi:hypothetical protein